MSQLILMIARIDDLDNPALLTELWRGTLPEIDLTNIRADHYLDDLEHTVTTLGWDAMRSLLVEQWRRTDQHLVARFRAQHRGASVGDGYDLLKVASRFGVINLPRQVCYLSDADQHTLPGNAGLPAHTGQLTTRGLQEWACLLPQDLPFATAQRLLGWMTHDPHVLSETQLRRWVAAHGQLIRQSEQAEVQALLAQPDLHELQAQLCARDDPRRKAAWPVELNQAVETALASEDQQPPLGVTAVDWERVLQVRQADARASAEQLRRLGPDLQPGELLASVDEVAVRRPEQRRFLELGTAYVQTVNGYRYLSGSLALVLQQLFLLLRLCGGGVSAKVTLLGDGARWIERFFEDRLADWPLTILILDWYHCYKKCYELTGMICQGRQAKTVLLGQVLRKLWQGEVQAAIGCLEAYREQAKNGAKLDELISYLQHRAAYIPNYRERRAHQHYIGSAQVEKGNDLLVARRQKHQGMHWSEQTSDALAALRTLLLNGGWDGYWQQHQVLPLAMPIGP